MRNESIWVQSLVDEIQNRLPKRSAPGKQTTVVSGLRVVYRNVVFGYKESEPSSSAPRRYETDILIRDQCADGMWVPRVVIECKLGAVTTHDALTYSAKAETHKQVHPYLRYGILVGNYGARGVPGRLFHHGGHFDFMATWNAKEASPSEWDQLVRVLREEISASRKIEELLTRRHSTPKYCLVHRRLVLC